MLLATRRFRPSRFMLPLLMVAVVLLAVVSEIAYRRAEDSLSGGISFVDARINAAALLQLLTDAETAQRGYLLTGNEAYIAPLRNAQYRFGQRSASLDFIAGQGSASAQDADAIRAAVAAKFAELDRTIELAQSGDRTAALALVRSDSGRQLMVELREMFKSRLDAAAVQHQGARDRIHTALQSNHLALLVLCGLLLMGLYRYWRQQRLFEHQRVDEQHTLEQTVTDKTQELRTLSGWLQTAREDEKAHLARELHDELGGILTSAKLMLARVRSRVTGQVEVLALIEGIHQQLSQGIALKRRIIEDLRPSTLSELGLTVALDTLCRDAAMQLAIPVVATISDVHLSNAAELAVFRVVQEALTNVGKYASAGHVSVTLKQVGGQVQLDIADDGAGFDASGSRAGRHGLAGMQFRIETHGGSLSVVTAPQQGVCLRAILPVSVQAVSTSTADSTILAGAPLAAY